MNAAKTNIRSTMVRGLVQERCVQGLNTSKKTNTVETVNACLSLCKCWKLCGRGEERKEKGRHDKS